MRARGVEVRCFHIEINVLIIDVLDGVGLDPESYDETRSSSLICSSTALVHRNNLDVIEEKMLGLPDSSSCRKPRESLGRDRAAWSTLWSVNNVEACKLSTIQWTRSRRQSLARSFAPIFVTFFLHTILQG